MTETEASTSGADRLTSGFNHVAVITRDLDRAVEFWSTTLNAEFRDISDHHGRHLRRARYGSRFAPAPLRGPEDYTGPIANGPMMKRGRIDHQATAASDEHALLVIRDRLVERGASAERSNSSVTTGRASMPSTPTAWSSRSPAHERPVIRADLDERNQKEEPMPTTTAARRNKTRTLELTDRVMNGHGARQIRRAWPSR